MVSSAGKKVWIGVGLLALMLGHLQCALAGVRPVKSDDTTQTATDKATTKSAKGKSKARKKDKGPKQAQVLAPGKTDPGWGETGEQRAARLARECKGKPNAGACEGFGG